MKRRPTVEMPEGEKNMTEYLWNIFSPSFSSLRPICLQFMYRDMGLTSRLVYMYTRNVHLNYSIKIRKNIIKSLYLLKLHSNKIL